MMQRKLMLFLALFIVVPVWATELFEWKPVKVRTSEDGLLHWVRAEAYRDRHPGFVMEKILPVTKYKNPQVLQSFPESLYEGDGCDSSLMLLLYGPDWDSSHKTPILLVHGAGDDAFRVWTHPYTFETPEYIPPDKEGFMQKFVRAGYPVFAVNFSHNHGCNYLQAEQIHNAVQVIRQRTGANKVHLVAHSKGNCSASIYLCGGREVYPEKYGFLSPFENDVDIYVQIAPANKGNDVVFRYYAGNMTIVGNNTSAPVCFYRALAYGCWRDFYREDIYQANPGEDVGNYFPGQCQGAYNLVADGLNFSFYSYTPFDLNLTMNACYYGGQSMFVAGYGIEHAIEEGGRTIERINKRGLDPSVRLVSMYGTYPVLQEIELGFIKIPVGVPDYPSDGVIYVHSARYIAGLLSRGAILLAQGEFKKNHVTLALHDDAFQWIEEQMRKN